MENNQIRFLEKRLRELCFAFSEIYLKGILFLHLILAWKLMIIYTFYIDGLKT